jgi:hypothetical protein
MKFLALAELIPLLLMGAAAQAPSCAEQRAPNEASVTAPSGTLEDLSLYRPEELETYQAHCDQEVKAAIERGDNAGAQSWARLRAAVIAEIERRREVLATQTPHKTGNSRRRYRQAPESTPRESTPQPTPEEYLLPPGWPVGPKE